MAQVYFSPLSGQEDGPLQVDLENFMPENCLNNNNIECISVDEGDVFQCGKCSKSFDLLTDFIAHKQSLCLGGGGSERQERARNTEFQDPVLLNLDLSKRLFLNNNPLESFPLDSSGICDKLEGFDTASSDDSPFESSLKVTSLDDQLVDCSGIVGASIVPDPPCLTDFNSSDNIIILNDNNNESEIVCESLDVSSSLNNNYNNNNNNFKCIYCSKAFNKLFNLKQHLRSHTGERPYQCLICGRTFSQNSNAKKHIDSHKVWPKVWKTLPSEFSNNGDSAGQEPCSFQCLYCPSIFKTYVELKSHRKIHSSHKVFKCFLSGCKESFSDVESYAFHRGSHHLSAGYWCHVCQEGFPTLEALEHHLLSCLQPTLPNKSPVSLSCFKCKAKFRRRESLERHLMEESHAHECRECGHQFPAERTLRRHLASAHRPPVSKHSCPQCGKRFSSQQALSHHSCLAIRYRCLVCPASFKRKDNYNRHCASHNKACFKFKCPFVKAGCNKSFSRIDVLKNHIATHRSKEMACNTCGKPLTLDNNKRIDVDCDCLTGKKSCSEDDCIELEDEEERVSDEAGIVPAGDIPTVEVVVVPVSHSGSEPVFQVIVPSAHTLSH